MKQAETSMGVYTGILIKIINEEVDIEPNGICVLLRAHKSDLAFLG